MDKNSYAVKKINLEKLFTIKKIYFQYKEYRLGFYKIFIVKRSFIQVK